MPEPPDPTTRLAWATPPASVGCVVRGTGTPFPRVCDPELVTVRERDADIATFNPTQLDVVWGIPRKAAHVGGLWVHARGGGLSVTGFARSVPKFAMRKEAMLIKDHVWVKKDAPVVPAHADQEVAISIQDDVAGVADVRGSIGCDDLSFEPLEVTPFATPVVPAAEPATEPVVKYPTGASLTVFAGPGGAALTTLRGTDEHPLYVDLEVKATRGSFTRVTFETTHARFDGWVRNSEIGDDAAGGLGFTDMGCGGRFHGYSHARLMGQSTAIHLGKDAAGKKPTAGLQIAEGTVFVAQERKDGFVAITPYGSPIVPPGEQQFWVPESALDAAP